MGAHRKDTDRREFLQMLRRGAVAGSLQTSIAQALEIPANNRSELHVALAGHVETGRDSYSDPAMGGLVNLRA